MFTNCHVGNRDPNGTVAKQIAVEVHFVRLALGLVRIVPMVLYTVGDNPNREWDLLVSFERPRVAVALAMESCLDVEDRRDIVLDSVKSEARFRMALGHVRGCLLQTVA